MCAISNCLTSTSLLCHLLSWSISEASEVLLFSHFCWLSCLARSNHSRLALPHLTSPHQLRPALLWHHGRHSSLPNVYAMYWYLRFSQFHRLALHVLLLCTFLFIWERGLLLFSYIFSVHTIWSSTYSKVWHIFFVNEMSFHWHPRNTYKMFVYHARNPIFAKSHKSGHPAQCECLGDQIPISCKSGDLSRPLSI